MNNIFLGVQPIFDRDRQVVAYELLFRDASGGFEGSRLDGDAATSQVIINAFSDIGVERLGRDKLLFLNLTESLLASDIIQMLPPERVVLEILETAQITPELVDAVRQLVGQGFRIALDDFIYHTSWDPLLDLCHIVKFDVLGDDERAMRAKFESLPRRNRPQLLAEKVENKFQFVECLNLGFDLFQGYYLARPRVISGKRPPGNRIQILNLLAQLQDDSISLQQVEHLIAQDVTLSYRLLRILGSAAISQGRPIHNLKQAIALVGLRAIRRWAALIMLGGLDVESQFSITRSLTYARFCQIVGERHLHAAKDALFTVGLFSNLDELLEVSLDEALQPLPLDEEIKGAILRHEGLMGQVLVIAKRFESDGSATVTPPAGLDMPSLSAYFLEAFAWAQDIQSEMTGSSNG
mgnify:CR=1 FL=1